MKTSKITILVLATAILFASCNGKGIKGTAIEWPTDERVLVVNNGGVFKPDYVAIFPAVNTEGVANSVEGMNATFNLPATQAYAEGSFDELSMPKVAFSIGEEFQFKYVLGGLCLPLLGDSVRVTKVVLSSADADEALWGVCKTVVSTKGEDPTSTITNDEVGKNTVTLDCGEGVMLNGTTATDFYMAVPEGTLESGFTVEVFDGENLIFEKSANKALGKGFILRNIIRKAEGNLEIIAQTDSVL